MSPLVTQRHQRARRPRRHGLQRARRPRVGLDVRKEQRDAGAEASLPRGREERRQQLKPGPALAQGPHSLSASMHALQSLWGQTNPHKDSRAAAARAPQAAKPLPPSPAPAGSPEPSTQRFERMAGRTGGQRGLRGAVEGRWRLGGRGRGRVRVPGGTASGRECARLRVQPTVRRYEGGRVDVVQCQRPKQHGARAAAPHRHVRAGEGDVGVGGDPKLSVGACREVGERGRGQERCCRWVRHQPPCPGHEAGCCTGITPPVAGARAAHPTNGTCARR